MIGRSTSHKRELRLKALRLIFTKDIFSSSWLAPMAGSSTGSGTAKKDLFELAHVNFSYERRGECSLRGHSLLIRFRCVPSVITDFPYLVLAVGAVTAFYETLRNGHLSVQRFQPCRRVL